MTGQLTAKDIAAALGITVRAVQLRAAKERWPCSEKKVHGGTCKVFLPNELPQYVKVALARHEALASMRAAADAGQTGSSQAFAAAPPEEQAQALAKAALVEQVHQKVGDLTRRTPRAATRAIDRVLDAYAAKVWRPTFMGPNGGGKPAEQNIFDVLGPKGRASVYRYKTAFEMGGLDALLRQPASRPRKIPDDIRKEIERMIWEKPRRSMAIYRYLEVAFSSRDDLPHRTTVHRFHQEYKREFGEALALHHGGEQGWRKGYLQAIGDASAKAQQPNDVWEADTTPADLLCKDGKRCKVIGIIDVFSRRPIFRVFPTSNGWGIAQTLRSGILSWGIPHTLLKDNGRDYQSTLVNQACKELNIETPKIPFRSPERKPHIERIFRTLSEGLFAELTGYTGNCVLNRPGEIHLEYTAQEVQERIDAWVTNVYEEREHRSLGRRPREAFQAPGFEPRVVASERQLDLLLMPSKVMLVRQGAIRRTVEGRTLTYFHPALLNLTGKKVGVKLDLNDAGSIYVFWARGFVCRAVDVKAAGVKVEEIVNAGKARKKHVKAVVKSMTGEFLQPGPVDQRLHEMLAAKSGEKPFVLPPRQAEVVAFPQYAQVEERERETAAEDAPLRAPAPVIPIEVKILPEKKPKGAYEPEFWEGDDPFFIDGWKKYQWIHKDRLWRGLPISDATRAWMEDYETTSEYRRMFVDIDMLGLFRWMEPKTQEGQGGDPQ